MFGTIMGRAFLTGMSFIIGAGMIAANNAHAAWPDKPVRFIVGFPPGGGVDTLTRIFGQKMSEKWGVPVLVEDKPGSSGMIAADYIAHGAPDGYSVAWITNAHTVTPTMNKLNYDPIKSFAPVTQIAYGPDVLVVIPSLPVHTLKELIEYAKARPGQVNYGTSGVGSAPYLETALLMQMTGINMVHVPFKGGTIAVTSMLGDETHIKFGAMPTVLPAIRSGQIRAIAVSANVRSLLLPEVPTVAEALGIDHFDGANTNWTGVLAAAGTPADIVNKMQQDIAEAAHLPDVEKQLANIGFVPVVNTPEQFTEVIRNEIERWKPLLQSVAKE